MLWFGNYMFSPEWPQENLDPERQFRGHIGLVLERFKDAIFEDIKPSVGLITYRHVLTGRDQDSGQPYVTFGLCWDYNRWSSEPPRDGGPRIQVTFPIEEPLESDPPNYYRAAIGPDDLTSHFFIRNLSTAKVINHRIDLNNQGVLDIALNSRGKELRINPRKLSKRVETTYLRLLLSGVPYPLRRHDSGPAWFPEH